MNNKLILPTNYLEKIDAPLIFLAGPIQGAYRWQDQAIQLIQQQAPELYIACPRRSLEDEKNFKPEDFDPQVDWETYHLKKAGENGTILFWLAKESEHVCERPYAQTSRFELAEWKMRHERDGSNLTIGIEKGFNGIEYIQRKLNQDCPHLKIYSTLEETCSQAVRIAKMKKKAITYKQKLFFQELILNSSKSKTK